MTSCHCLTFVLLTILVVLKLSYAEESLKRSAKNRSPFSRDLKASLKMVPQPFLGWSFPDFFKQFNFDNGQSKGQAIVHASSSADGGTSVSSTISMASSS